MLSTMVLSVTILLLAYRCYINDVNMHTLSEKHNELCKTVNRNAELLVELGEITNVLCCELDAVIQDYYEERGEIIDEN